MSQDVLAAWLFYSVPLEGYPQATTLNMTTYTWDEAKRKSNLRKHELDMKYESSLLDGQVDGKRRTSSDEPASWIDVMPHNYDDIEIDEDCPEYDPRYFTEPVHRFKGRIIPPRTSPTDPFDPEVLASMKSKTPLVQMEPGILGGMPVFKNTLVPIKRMFDYLLAGKTMAEFLRDYPDVSREKATGVLENQLTLFYEEISNAMDSEAGLTSLSK